MHKLKVKLAYYQDYSPAVNKLRRLKFVKINLAVTARGVKLYLTQCRKAQKKKDRESVKENESFPFTPIKRKWSPSSEERPSLGFHSANIFQRLP